MKLLTRITSIGGGSPAEALSRLQSLGGAGRFVEVQGTGEEATFSDDDLAALLKLARRGIGQLRALQQSALGEHWPF